MLLYDELPVFKASYDLLLNIIRFTAYLLRVDVGVFGVGFDELPAGRHIIAHEHGKDPVGFGAVFDIYLP
jgi:hypothetical protein